jgi:PAS domain S-box-containing protein
MGEPIRSPSEGPAIVAASIDGAGLVEDGSFVTANDQLATSFGYDTVDHIVGTPWRDLYPDRVCERIEREALSSVRSAEGWRGEVKGVRRDGAPLPHLLSIRRAANGRLVWIVRDQREQAADDTGLDRKLGPAEHGTHTGDPERDPAESRVAAPDGAVDGRAPATTRFQPFVETAPVPIVVFTADRGIVYCNPKAVEFLGADDRTAVLGTAPEQFVHPEEREQARRRIRRVLDERAATEPVEYRLCGVDDRERFAEIATAPVAFEGEPAAYVLINDVTELERSKQQLRRKQQFLETVLDTVDDVVYVLDADGQAYRWNDTLAERTGYTHEEIESMHAKEFIPEDQHEYVPGLMEAMASFDDQRVELDVLTNDGDAIPHEFSGTTFEDPATGEVFRCGVARDISDRLDRERRLERYETIVETASDGIYALDEDLRFSFVNEALCEMMGRPREDVIGQPVRDFLSGDELAFADELRERAIEGDSITGTVQSTLSTPDGERVLEAHYRLHPEPDGEFRGSVGVVRDVTEREERKRQLERTLDELATLNRVNRILRETTRDLIRTADRDVIERTVCTQLAKSDLYEFAWIGERAVDDHAIAPRTTAGDDRGLLDAIVTETDGDGVDGDPAQRALERGSVQVATEEHSASTPWQDAASDRGFASTAAVPLQHDDTVYGVLAIHTARENAFNDRERDVFDVLGRTIGYIINAVKNRKLLLADTVRELEFRTADADSVFVDTAVELDCELDLEGYVDTGDQCVLYFAVDGASVADVVSCTEADPRLERARDVSVTDSDGRVELTVAESSLVHTVTRAGGSLSSATVTADRTRFLVEAPVDADVREIVDHVQREHPGVDFVAQRDRDREVSQLGRPDGLLGDLTDRQREMLEAAYRSGYFAWPRASTAEDVAASLNLTSATLHGHLRKAEATIFAALFDED